MSRIEKPGYFVKALEDVLAKWSPRVEKDRRWGEAGYRSHLMLGRAERGKSKAAREYILGDVMKIGGFSRYGSEERHRELRRVYGHEWRKFDLLACECPNNWDDDCWAGSYTIKIAVEVENDLKEFALTMRGLLDIRADLHVGIFYVPDEHGDDLDSLEVWTSRRDKKLGSWTPPGTDGNWAWPFDSATCMMAVFLSKTSPSVIGKKVYRPPAVTE